jgi:hypothetical protein
MAWVRSQVRLFSSLLPLVCKFEYPEIPLEGDEMMTDRNQRLLILLAAVFLGCGGTTSKSGTGQDSAVATSGDAAEMASQGDSGGADRSAPVDSAVPGDGPVLVDTNRIDAAPPRDAAVGADRASPDARTARDDTARDTSADNLPADARPFSDAVVPSNDGAGASWWKPVAGTTWQWQIGGGTFDTSLAVQVFDIDWEEPASAVQSLHAAGKKVICYLSVGSWEDWRPDAAQFPSAVIGTEYPGWPGEKFVDIRAQALRDIMAKRLDVCKQKGFDAVEPDNMDVFEASSGFPLTRTDGINYALWLAEQSHQRGMAIVQKNASSIVRDIRASYDGALTEDCYDGGWCADMQPYLDNNQPVFACEYESSGFSAACTWGKAKKYSFILKKLDLDAWIQFCP